MKTMNHVYSELLKTTITEFVFALRPHGVQEELYSLLLLVDVKKQSSG